MNKFPTRCLRAYARYCGHKAVTQCGTFCVDNETEGGRGCNQDLPATPGISRSAIVCRHGRLADGAAGSDGPKPLLWHTSGHSEGLQQASAGVLDSMKDVRETSPYHSTGGRVTQQPPQFPPGFLSSSYQFPHPPAPPSPFT